MPHPRTRTLVAALFAVLACATAAHAQPSGRTIKVIYAFAAGNSGDSLARIVADRLTARLGNPAIVENRAGASARIGTKAVIAAEPDGTTLLLSPMGPAALHPVSYGNLDFDPFTDLAPITQVATFDIALMVSTGLPVRTVKELVEWLKANPDKANYGTPGLGGLPHFFAVMFSTGAGVTMSNVPYRGGAAVLNDIVAGQLPIAFIITADGLGVASSGKVRVLATSGSARSQFIKDVPTLIEAGYQLRGEGWFGLYAPVRTPAETVARLSREMQAALQEPATRERITGLGLVPTGTTAEALQRQQKADRELWAPAIRASGFKPTD